jgi:hypothetical protein
MPRRKTQGEFVVQAQAKHFGFYDYTKVIYVSSNAKVDVICPSHGEFKITPEHHLQGVGCRKCFDDRHRNQQSNILDRFHQAHGDRYGYDKVVYKRIDIKVVINCVTHGDFEQTPSAHISGSGCVKCAIEEQRSTTENFITKAREKHGEKYDYTQTEYITEKVKVVIGCPEHGVFEQMPRNHIKGVGCPICARESAKFKQFKFKYKRVEYASIKDACKAFDKDYWKVLKRLEAGWDLRQAFDDVPRTYTPRSFTFKGITYNGVDDAVRQLNAPVSGVTVRRRLAQGMTPEEALFTPPNLGYSNGIIYLITNLVNNKKYVGLTTTSLDQRWESHLDTSRKNAGLVHKAIAEFGKENFTIELIDSASNPKELRVKEREWIKKLNTSSPNGYNSTNGGEIGGSCGKPTRLPNDPILYPTVREAAKALAEKEGISIDAAKKRIHTGRFEFKKPHGMSDSPIYNYWSGLIHQLANPNSSEWNGSIMCERWKDFRNFYDDMSNSWDQNLYLKLIDPHLPYSKENCTLVPRQELYQTHGMSRTKFYRLWSALVYYKASPKSKKYKGVPMCDRWRDFTLFYEDMHPTYCEGMKLTLIDRSKPYSQQNCKWTNMTQRIKLHLRLNSSP